MNRNSKLIKRGLTTSLAVGMSVMVGAMPVYAASSDKKDNDDKLYKEETVYVNADASGNTDEITVSNWLKNAGSEKELEEMESADRITDRETMRKIIHRMMPVWEMLGKDNILRDFQRLLHDSDSQNETVHEHAIQIMEWLKILIEETKKELKKYENSDS